METGISKREIIERLFALSVKTMNKEMNMQEYHDMYCHDEDRSLLVHIEDIPDAKTGFVISGGTVRQIDITDRPTTEVWLQEDTFIRISTGEVDIMTAWLEGYVTFDGDNWFRDLGIFQRVSQQNSSLFSKLRG